MAKSYRNVCELVVPNDLCVGCGVCAGICPAGVLTMCFNEFGAYIPVEEKEGCLPKCDLCLRACPFTDQEDNEDTLAQAAFAQTLGIRHTPELGYYLDTYVGYSRVNSHREKGASGGLVTWFLETLLTRDMVDRVICVMPNPGDPQKLFRFAVLSSVGTIRDASRSCYYPVEMSGVIQEILSQEGQYAITGLPCFLKGLRLAMRKDRRLSRRIVALVGLVCGQTKTRLFAEYLCAACGGDPDNLVEIQFKLKDPTRSVMDYAHQFTWKDQDRLISRKMYWTEGIQNIWTRDYFKPNACNFCDDVFAETADVVFMDAWLSPYIYDSQGHSLVINRQAAFKSLWDEMLNADEINLAPISFSSVIQSQTNVLHNKRVLLQYRLYLARRAGQLVPRKRFGFQEKLTILERRLVRLKFDAREKSLIEWTQHQNPEKLRYALWRENYEIRFIRAWMRICKIFSVRRVISALTRRVNHLFRRNGNVL